MGESESTTVLEAPPTPKIYAYTTKEFERTPWRDGEGEGLLKVGYTTREPEHRIRQQFPVRMPGGQQWTVKLIEDAVGGSGTFTDRQVHAALVGMGRRNVEGEWFECTPDDVLEAIEHVRSGSTPTAARSARFKLRAEQEAAVDRAVAHYREFPKGIAGRAPRFLWNAKMRFGKTFATYQLARRMGWTRVLVLTFKPAVQDAWKSDLEGHEDFDGWQFIGKGDLFEDLDESKPIVWFASFQDVLGRARDGGIKERLEALHLTEWDCVVVDEYHFGAWRDTARELYESEPDEAAAEQDQGFDEATFPLSVAHYLYLSGTPFRALANGEFTEDEIFTWSYGDEQRAKEIWTGSGVNPYEELPKMVMLTYQLPPDIRRVAQESDLDEFDLNLFFRASMQETSAGKAYRFENEQDVQKWLNLIRGQHLPYDTRLAGVDVVPPPVPFDDSRLLATLRHTFWFLPSVAACHAMAELLRRPENSFFDEYEVIVAAGKDAGLGVEALRPVREKITDLGTKTKSITLSCMKLTTGVTVKEWSGVFMLRNLASPETYFQTAFRAQSPWTIESTDPRAVGERVVLKPLCYVLDFAPNRALRLVADYATELDPRSDVSAEKKVEQFLNYLPVLCYDGYSMTQLSAPPLLDFIVAGTGSTMLARRWQSARLVDVSNETLSRLLEHEDLLARLEEFESFRNLSRDITKTVNAEKALKKAKADNPSPTAEEKRALSSTEKELRSFRKQLRENLIKFAARVPVFMYLTDVREETLKQVITRIEPDLFKKVTNLSVGDFEVLCEVGVFNKTTMNSAVFAFRRFEDSSLRYAGGGRENLVFGGFDSYATREDVLVGRV